MGCPTLVIANDTKRRSIAEFKAYQKKIPDSELVAIKVDGYHTAAVAPDECARATLDFIARHASVLPFGYARTHHVGRVKPDPLI